MLGFSLEPPAREVAPDEPTGTVLVVENRGVTPVDVHVSAGASPLNVTLDRNNLTLEPGATGYVLANVTTTGLAAGNYTVEFRARDTRAGGAMSAGEATALFTVRVRAASPQNATTNGTGADTGTPAGTGDGAGSGDAAQSGNAAETGSAPETGGEPEPGEPAGNATGTGSAPETPPASNATTAAEPGANDTAPPSPAPDPSDAPPAPPTFSPDRLAVEVQALERAPFRFELVNPADVAQTVDLTLSLPLGWGGTLARTRVEVPGHGSALVEGTVSPARDAPPGEARLVARAPGGNASALLLLTPLPPSADPDARALPAEDDAAAASPPGEGATGDARPPARPPAPGVVALRMEPSIVRVPREGAAVATLVVENGGEAPIDAAARLLLPQGFSLDPDAPRALVAPGGTGRLALVLRAPDLPVGTEGAATAALAGVDADAAPFRLLVAAPSSSADASSLAARDAGAPWLAALLLGAAGGASALAALAWRRRWHLPLLALYARLKPGRVLEHPTRQALARLVAEEPGVRLADAQRRLGLANGRLRHHVDRLESTGVLHTVADGPHRRLYPTAMGRVAPTPGLSERLVALLRERGPLPAAAVAASLGVSRQALHYHVKKLAAQGRIDAAREGRDLRLAPRDAPPGTATLKAEARAADAWTRSSP